jgi:hypothetical protein
VKQQRLKQRQANLKAFDHLCRQDVTGAAAARNALAVLAKTLTRTTVMDHRIVAVPQYWRAGRPAKDRQPDESP